MIPTNKLSVCADDVIDRIFLLDLHLGRICATRDYTTPDGERKSKTILDCPELREIKRLHREFRDYTELYAIPCDDLFRPGMYLMPAIRIKQIDEYYSRAQERLDVLVENLLTLYDRRKHEAKRRLRKLYNEADYPDEKTIRQTYTVEYSFITLAVPDALKLSDSELYKRETKKLRSLYRKAADTSRNALAQQMQNMAEHCVDRLGVGLDGKPKVFRDSLLTNWHRFFELFDEKNISGDEELASRVHRLQEDIAKIGCCQLRENAKLREEIRVVFVDVINRMAEKSKRECNI